MSTISCSEVRGVWSWFMVLVIMMVNENDIGSVCISGCVAV